ncbi:MAG: hypothetical protein ACLFPS_02110 [Clostridia bacterium]
MAIDVVMNVVNQKKFLDKYSCVFTSSMNQEELSNYARLRYNDKDVEEVDISDKFEPFVADVGGKSCAQLPILDPLNTQKLAAKLYYQSERVAKKLLPLIEGMAERTIKDWSIVGPSILVHTVFGYVWQFIWSKMTVKRGGGTVTFVDSPHESFVLFSRTVSLDTNKLFIYWQTRLTYNDYVYHDIFNRPNMIKTLRSMDKNKIMVPHGGSEETLLKMHLAKRSNQLGSHATAYKSNVPEVELDDLKRIEEELKGARELALECFPNIIETIKGSRENAFKDMILVDDEDMLQAGYYVWAYLMFEQMRENKII